MSFIDAAQLASAGANQIAAGHSAPSQTVNDGVLVLAGETAAPGPQLQAFPPKPAFMPPGKARYELLRNIQRVAPKSEIGRQAHNLLGRQRLLSRARLSQTATRGHQAQVNAVIREAVKQPALIAGADPGHNLRDALAPASQPAQRRMAARYDVLKNKMPQPSTKASAKTISLKQLPQLQRSVYGLLKNAAMNALPPEIAAVTKPAASLAAMRPAGGKKRFLACSFA